MKTFLNAPYPKQSINAPTTIFESVIVNSFVLNVGFQDI